MCRLSRNSGSLNILQPSGLVQIYIGAAFYYSLQWIPITLYSPLNKNPGYIHLKNDYGYIHFFLSHIDCSVWQNSFSLTWSSFFKLVTDFVGGMFVIVGHEGIIHIAKSRDWKRLPPSSCTDKIGKHWDKFQKTPITIICWATTNPSSLFNFMLPDVVPRYLHMDISAIVFWNTL
jgi:hypothetical protein